MMEVSGAENALINSRLKCAHRRPFAQSYRRTRATVLLGELVELS